MTATASLSVAALTIDCADPAALAGFWGKALGRPVSPGADEEIERLTGLGARPLKETKLPAVRLGLATYTVRQTTFADPEGNEFDLVIWQQQPE